MFIELFNQSKFLLCNNTLASYGVFFDVQLIRREPNEPQIRFGNFLCLTWMFVYC